MPEPADQFVIALTGPIGSGCTTLSQGLAERGFRRVSLSDLIKDRFRKIHQKEPSLEQFGEDWRAELQDIGNEGRNGKFVVERRQNQDFRSYWVQLALDSVSDEKVVVDGLRNTGEVEWLRKQFGQFWLIGVYADFPTQWNRIKESNAYSNEKVFARDNRRDSGEDEPYGQNVRRCVYESDYIFKNTKHIEPARSLSE